MREIRERKKKRYSTPVKGRSERLIKEEKRKYRVRKKKYEENGKVWEEMKNARRRKLVESIHKYAKENLWKEGKE